VFVTSNKLFE